MTFDGYAHSSAHPEQANPDESSAGMKSGSGSVSGPAAEEPQPAAPGSEEALWYRQGLLSDLRDWIAAQPGITTSGYVTSVNDPENGSTVLVWHGPANRMRQRIVDEARRRHIPLSIQQSEYRPAALERAVEQLIAIGSGTGVFQNFMVSSIGTFGLDPAFDGVTVYGDYIDPPAEGIPAADSALARALTARTGVAVAIEHGRIELL